MNVGRIGANGRLETLDNMQGLERPAGFVIGERQCTELHKTQADGNGKRQGVEGMFKGGFEFFHNGLFYCFLP
jgi:hypothetical protein